MGTGSDHITVINDEGNAVKTHLNINCNWKERDTRARKARNSRKVRKAVYKRVTPNEERREPK